MIVLLIEDEQEKREVLINIIEDAIGQCELKVATAINPAIDIIYQNQIDFVILDMTLPFSQGEISVENPLNPFGGEELLSMLRECERFPSVAIVTQYSSFTKNRDIVVLDDLELKIHKKFSTERIKIFKYELERREWVAKLKTFLKENI